MNRRTDGQAASRSIFSRSIFRGATFWIALIAVVALFGLSSVPLHAESASTFFKRGQTAEAREDYDAAFDNYQKAYAKDPKDLEYRAALYRVRVTASAVHLTKGHKLLNAGDEQEALAEFLHAAEIDPGNEAAQQAIASVRKKHGEAAPHVRDQHLPNRRAEQEELDSMGAPAELKPVSNEPLTLHMTEDAKVIYQAVGKAAGVNVLFDPDYTSKRIQVDLNNVSLLDALRIVGTISNTFWRPVTEQHASLLPQTPAPKRTELDEQAVQTFYLIERLAAERPDRRADGHSQRADQRQDLRRAQPERDRDARHARRVAAGAKADQRPGQGAPRSGGGHRRPGGKQELGEDSGHRLAQQRRSRASAAQQQHRAVRPPRPPRRVQPAQQ